MTDASYIFIEREYWMKKKTFSLFCMFIQYPFWQVHRHHEKVFLLFSSSSCFSVIINITFINIPFFRTKILIVKLILTQKLVWYWGMHKNNLFLMRMQYIFFWLRLIEAAITFCLIDLWKYCVIKTPKL